MPRVTLSPSQLASAREIAEKAARIMEEKPTVQLGPHENADGVLSRDNYWRWDCDVADWYPRFSLDGTDPDADAIATARMKERLIELGNSFSVSYCPSSFLNPWGVSTGGWENSIRHAPLEVLAVAQALIAVDEERRK